MTSCCERNGKAQPDPGCGVPKGNMSTLLHFNHIEWIYVTCCVIWVYHACSFFLKKRKEKWLYHVLNRERSMHIQMLLPPVAVCLVWAPAWSARVVVERRTHRGIKLEVQKNCGGFLGVGLGSRLIADCVIGSRSWMVAWSAGIDPAWKRPSRSLFAARNLPTKDT